ncbi:glycosyltransferase family 2 protein [Chitinophaga rhizophila]|uniref:Glycosyltransferase n=1 Tax=Chitinophaga rhizophila TaxID=2866212 RepID=A0ABS7GJ64_9BACT|nr:glycosyltransferase family 2 protein [Chitinophaga rhizophila]MBW8687742.1 glycosyltransferase [Chitinophaga rhizophila]
MLLYNLFNRANIGNKILYWLLMSGIIYFCLKVLHEWYHYFNISIPKPPTTAIAPTVDILTTFCAGEPYEMVIRTLTAMQAITYPHTSWLCDEADDPYLKAVCQKLGVRHVTRDNRKDAKAGNINNALRFATGELCVVMDPDHVPTPDFLDRVVPYFVDPEIGFVQIVQAYGNIGDNIIAKGAAQQTFQFYGPMMMTMNTYGTVQAIGANCTFRRRALDSIGGHAAGLAEDMHTAMQLHAKGWKSVYIPEVLTLGLVPSTLSAYYKQQLKWARGTFELLLVTYPKLFTKFTWRQKLHYATLPFHYFSGMMFFLNFLVPVLSLTLGIIPCEYDFLSFSMLSIPFIASTILVRHFVQRWVMAEDESGFHIVGGLLLIGTWWIYILGLIYTIIRKKVPYIPTPKDDKEGTSWKLFIPNAIILLISLTAVIYGLWLDWNPYAWIMAGIAFLNCLIMLFNILAGIWKGRISNQQPKTTIEFVYHHYYATKIRLWKFRHSVYVMMRKSAMSLTIIICGFTSWFIYEDNRPPSAYRDAPQAKEAIFYSGLFSPADTTGITSLSDLRHFNKVKGTPFNIISLYIPWGETAACLPDDSLLHAIYNANGLPMITWEPWAALFTTAAQQSPKAVEHKMLARISEGKYNSYLERFVQKIISIQRPVFIRFAHEPDNPGYPWSMSGQNTPAEYVAAWRYVHDYFVRAGARNVIWIWNPWKANTADSYFPGTAYVDWLAVNVLNYGKRHPDGQWYSFHQLYQPFHQLSLFRTGIPVMIAETGSLADEPGQSGWLQDAFNAIADSFREIHATVLFNSRFDKNTIDQMKPGMLNWELLDPSAPLSLLKRLEQHSAIPVNDTLLLPTAPATVRPPDTLLNNTIRGVVYAKGIPWFRNHHTLTRKEVVNDLQEMRSMGINTIRRYGPGVYDHNIFAAAAALDMQIQYGFWMPAPEQEYGSEQWPESFIQSVVRTVKKYKDNQQIIGWHLGHNYWEELDKMYSKPSLLYHQDQYIVWLKKLVLQIKAADPSRPVTLDLPAGPQYTLAAQTIAAAIPELSAIGITSLKDSTAAAFTAGNMPCFLSGVDVEAYLSGDIKGPVFIDAWQDMQTRDAVTFNGLTDIKGHYKPAALRLAAHWHAPLSGPSLPEIKILKPARVTEPGSVLSYRALVQEKGQWNLDGYFDPSLQFNWYLYKVDRWGNPIYMQHAGTGATLHLSIPVSPAHYRLYLVAGKDKFVTTTSATLNTPWRKQ